MYRHATVAALRLGVGREGSTALVGVQHRDRDAGTELPGRRASTSTFATAASDSIVGSRRRCGSRVSGQDSIAFVRSVLIVRGDASGTIAVRK
ncbi:hypothetical protein C492_01114 [Natronococcus jeotgali DSM 18795]|uniref:Uncharacterized protein n=1 Tax=Natronococcus jeotgali DSM 18795 TaxID=1227498 RepID=L9XYH8_9EURY|nr:hypothetical protein C492_01114 [Natronococcus jeotgali DSM 18795]